MFSNEPIRTLLDYHIERYNAAPSVENCAKFDVIFNQYQTLPIKALLQVNSILPLAHLRQQNAEERGIVSSLLENLSRDIVVNVGNCNHYFYGMLQVVKSLDISLFEAQVFHNILNSVAEKLTKPDPQNVALILVLLEKWQACCKNNEKIDAALSEKLLNLLQPRFQELQKQATHLSEPDAFFCFSLLHVKNAVKAMTASQRGEKAYQLLIQQPIATISSLRDYRTQALEVEANISSHAEDAAKIISVFALFAYLSSNPAGWITTGIIVGGFLVRAILNGDWKRWWKDTQAVLRGDDERDVKDYYFCHSMLLSLEGLQCTQDVQQWQEFFSQLQEYLLNRHDLQVTLAKVIYIVFIHYLKKSQLSPEKLIEFSTPFVIWCTHMYSQKYAMGHLKRRKREPVWLTMLALLEHYFPSLHSLIRKQFSVIADRFKSSVFKKYETAQQELTSTLASPSKTQLSYVSDPLAVNQLQERWLQVCGILSLEPIRDYLKQPQQVTPTLSWEQVELSYIEPRLKTAREEVSLNYLYMQLLDSARASQENEQNISVLLGETRTGRSSAMHWLYAKLKEAYLKKPYDLQQPIPIFISLASMKPDEPDFIGKWFLELTKNNDYKYTSQMVEQLRKDYRFIFLLDGYDELIAYHGKMKAYNILKDAHLEGWKGSVLLSCDAFWGNECQSFDALKTYYLNDTAGFYADPAPVNTLKLHLINHEKDPKKAKGDIESLFVYNDANATIDMLYKGMLNWTQAYLEVARKEGCSKTKERVVNFWNWIRGLLKEKPPAEEKLPKHGIRDHLLHANIDHHWEYYCQIISTLQSDARAGRDWYRELRLEKLRTIWPVTHPEWRKELIQQIEQIADKQRPFPAWYDDAQNLLREIRRHGNYASFASISPHFNNQQASAIQLPLRAFAQQSPEDTNSPNQIFSLTYGSCELLSNIHNQLFENDENWHKTEPPAGQNHHVRMVSNNNFKLHIKFLPDCPGIGYAVSKLHQQLIGHGTPAMDVQIWPPGTFGQSTQYPVIVSETIEGVPLDRWPKEQPLNLDSKHFSDYFLMVLLKCPMDEKPGNFIVQNISGTNRRRLVNIDNDQALIEMPVKKIKLANNQQGCEIKLNLKSIIFCMPEMQQPLHPSSIDNFLSHDPYRVLNNWLQSMRDFNKRLRENCFITDSICQDWFGDRAYWLGLKRPVRIPFLFSEELKRVYQHFVKIQYLLNEQLREQRTLTHAELLAACLPEVATFYDETPGANAWEKFEYLHKDQYKPVKILVDHATHSAQRSAVLQSSTTARDVSSKSPSVSDELAIKTLQHLEQMHKQQREIHVVQDKLLRCEGGKEALHKLNNYNPFWAEQAIFGDLHLIPPLKLSTHSEAVQDYILDAMAGVKFERLDLKDCRQLTSQRLLNILKSSPELRYLDISNCQQLKDADIANIANNCPCITHLYANNLKISSFIQNTSRAIESRIKFDTTKIAETVTYSAYFRIFCSMAYVIAHIFNFKIDYHAFIAYLVPEVIFFLLSKSSKINNDIHAHGFLVLLALFMAIVFIILDFYYPVIWGGVGYLVACKANEKGFASHYIGAIGATTGIIATYYLNNETHSLKMASAASLMGAGVAAAVHAAITTALRKNPFINLQFKELQRLSLNNCSDLRKIYLNAPKLKKLTAEAVSVIYCHLDDKKIFKTHPYFPAPFALPSRIPELAQATTVPFYLQYPDEVKKIAEIEIPELLAHWHQQCQEILKSFTKCSERDPRHREAVEELSKIIPESAEALRYIGKYYQKVNGYSGANAAIAQQYFAQAKQWFSKHVGLEPQWDYYLANLCHKLIDGTAETQRVGAVKRYESVAADQRADNKLKAKAYFQLGRIYELGDCGVAKSLGEAIEYYSKAKELKYMRAEAKLDELLFQKKKQ